MRTQEARGISCLPCQFPRSDRESRARHAGRPNLIQPDGAEARPNFIEQHYGETAGLGSLTEARKRSAAAVGAITELGRMAQLVSARI